MTDSIELSNVIREIEKELSVNADGKAFVTVRGAARLVGIHHSALTRHIQKSSGDFSSGKLAEMLAPFSFEGGDISDLALAVISS